MSRRWVLVVAGALAGAALAAAAGAEAPPVTSANVRAAGPPAASGAQPETDEVETAAVVRTDLVTTDEVDGAVTYRDRRTLGSPLDGTVTWLPAEGATVGLGETLWRIDEQPTSLLPGAVPAWRTLNTASEGEDVRQLETWLVNAGWATAEQLTVDDDYTNATANAVERWHEAQGVEETGVVELGSVVFCEHSVRVAEHGVGIGAPAGPELLTVTGTTRTVVADVPAADAGQFAAGDALEVELPDETRTPGTVAAVGATAEVAEDGSATVMLTVEAPAIPASVPDEAPVDLHVADEVASEVLAVPVEALLALAEGGYAVETEAGELVAVETGMFADGLVEVTGDVEEGDRVVVAR